MRRLILGLGVVALLLRGVGQVQGQAGTLWYNGDAVGRPAYANGPGQIPYNDFNVTDAGWTVTSVWSNDNGNMYLEESSGYFSGPRGIDTSAGVGGSSIATSVPSTLIMSSIMFGMFGAVWLYKWMRGTTVAA